jgi:hypothetical protein
MTVIWKVHIYISSACDTFSKNVTLSFNIKYNFPGFGGPGVESKILLVLQVASGIHGSL